MHFSAPSLHHATIVLPDHKIAVENKLLEIHKARARAAPMAAVSSDSLEIPLTTVSLAGNFDAYIGINFRRDPGGSTVSLLLDSGNSVLIVPRWEDIAALPNSSTDYKILGTGREPWGCPANIVRGPIEIATAGSGVFTIANCVFYACTGESPSNERTANFGAGCLSPWSSSGWNTPAGVGTVLQAPLSYNMAYPYVEFNYESALNILESANTPNISTGSSLVLYKERPSGYRMFRIIADVEWMALRPNYLSIGGTKTNWPGGAGPTSIAMIDTGGGPAFLSDPDGYLYNKKWPDPVSNPDWTSTSQDCESTSDLIEIGIGDDVNSITYKIDPAVLPATDRGLTLVMCRENFYMMKNRGMNIGGISALVNLILVDYENSQVGLKSK